MRASTCHLLLHQDQVCYHPSHERYSDQHKYQWVSIGYSTRSSMMKAVSTAVKLNRSESTTCIWSECSISRVIVFNLSMDNYCETISYSLYLVLPNTNHTWLTWFTDPPVPILPIQVLQVWSWTCGTPLVPGDTSLSSLSREMALQRCSSMLLKPSDLYHL